MCQPLNKVEELLHESCACPFLCLKSSVRHSWPLKWSQQCIVITVYHLRNNKTKKSRQVSRFSTQKTETELPFQVQSQRTKQFPSTVILHICNPNTWEIKALEDHPLRASLGYMGPCFKQTKQNPVSVQWEDVLSLSICTWLSRGCGTGRDGGS